MKLLFTFISIIALTSSQSPVPIPALNINLLNGQWYVIWEYDVNLNNTKPVPVSCVELSLSVNAKTGAGVWNQSVILNGQVQTSTNVFVTQGQNAVWLVNGLTIEWIDFDVVGHSWFVGAAKGYQIAFVIARQAAFPVNTLANLVQFVQKEGYTVNSTNAVLYNNTNCQSDWM